MYCVSVCAHSCLTLCNPVDCSHPGFSVHGISQASILEWVAISYSRECSQPRDRICVLHLLQWRADSLPLYHLETWKCWGFSQSYIIGNWQIRIKITGLLKLTPVFFLLNKMSSQIASGVLVASSSLIEGTVVFMLCIFVIDFNNLCYCSFICLWESRQVVPYGKIC